MAQSLLSYIAIAPFEIPITRNGKQIVFNGFDGEEDKKAGIYIHRSVARLDKGIPNPKVRPVVRAPWEINFTLTIYPNDDFNEELVHQLIQKSGIAIGLGTFRGVFGKFEITQWK